MYVKKAVHHSTRHSLLWATIQVTCISILLLLACLFFKSQLRRIERETVMVHFMTDLECYFAVSLQSKEFLSLTPSPLPQSPRESWKECTWLRTVKNGRKWPSLCFLVIIYYFTKAPMSTCHCPQDLEVPWILFPLAFELVRVWLVSLGSLCA